MILRNVASQPILIGPLAAIADGALQTSGAAIAVRKDGADVGSPAGTLSHIASGIHQYVPTQGETDCGIIGLILTKADCLPVAVNVLTTRLPIQTTTGGTGGLATFDNVDGLHNFNPTTQPVIVGTNNDKSNYALSSAQVTALVAAIEAEIADDATGEAVKQAIIDKLLENLPDLDDLTLGAIATSVWSHATRTLTEGLLDAAGIQTALGMSAANMDTQLAAISQAITDAQSAILAEGAASWTTAVGFSTVTTADILTQAAAALVAIHLDHLFAVTYDPASKPGVADALFNELVESDSGVSRFTVNALEQAPAGGGGGGSATLENQEAILSAISTVQTTVSGASITVVSPISEDGQTLTIVRGDDYLNDNGRAITFSSTSWPDLTGATFLFAAQKNGATDFVGTVTGTSVGGATQTVRLELPTAQTSLASVSPLGSPYKWDIEATLSDGAIVTIARGIAVVIEDYA